MDMSYVLVVDDDPVTLCLLDDLIGFHLPSVSVVTESSSVVAFERVKAHPYDVLIIDLAMPEMDGATLAANLYHFNPLIPVILISGGPLQGSPPLNMFAYLSKPIDCGSFIHIVNQAIEHRRFLHPSTCDCGDKLLRVTMLPEGVRT